MPLQSLAGGGGRCQTEVAHSRRYIRSRGFNPLLAFRIRSLDGRPLLNPLHVKISVAQSQDWRHDARKPVPGQKSMVTEPAPADALGQHVSGFFFSSGRLDVDFVDSLQSPSAFVGGEILQVIIK